MMQHHRGRILWSAALLPCIGVLGAQTVNPTPASIQDLSSAIPVSETFSFEPQIQNGVQAIPPTATLRIRTCDADSTLATLRRHPGSDDYLAVSYIYYFTVPGTSYTKHLEWRFTTFGTLRQSPSGGSLYEQLLFELLNFCAGNGDVQHLPRVRFRLGQNLYLSEGRSKPYLGLYEEAIVQFPQLLLRLLSYQLDRSSRRTRPC
jgi:hypothetical protein